MNSHLTPPAEEKPCHRNWVDLPPEVTASILRRLGPIHIITSAQYVCSTWRRICKDDPSMWRSIHMRDPDYYGDDDDNGDDDGYDDGYDDGHDVCYDLEKICRHAAERSSGDLHEIEFHYFACDGLLRYISDRCCNVKILRLIHCPSVSNKCLSKLAPKFCFLEELDLSYSEFVKGTIEQMGRCCPLLVSLKLNNKFSRSRQIGCDDTALAIANTMPGLQRLQIFGNRLKNEGLRAILDSCSRLEMLDLRHCFNVNDRDLERRCLERIKDFRAPNDSTADYPYRQEVHGLDSSEEEDSYGTMDDDSLYDDDDMFYAFSDESDMSF